MSLPFGTQVPNPLALAAIDDLQVTTDISRIIAEEAAFIGVNWSFTPVMDINQAFRSSIVGTRSFGADVETICRHAVSHIEALQRHGVAATAKHWPGEGYDDRDQHLVTTINPLSMAEWNATFGNSTAARSARASSPSCRRILLCRHSSGPSYPMQVLKPSARRPSTGFSISSCFAGSLGSTA
jgi:hypothetical protein